MNPLATFYVIDVLEIVGREASSLDHEEAAYIMQTTRTAIRQFLAARPGRTEPLTYVILHGLAGGRPRAANLAYLTENAFRVWSIRWSDDPAKNVLTVLSWAIDSAEDMAKEVRERIAAADPEFVKFRWFAEMTVASVDVLGK